MASRPRYVTQEHTRRVLDGLFALEDYQPWTPMGRTAYAIHRLG